MLPVVLGQNLGCIGIMAVAVTGALGAGVLPEPALPYLGLSPAYARPACSVAALAGKAPPGLRRHDRPGWAGALSVPAVTFANADDNIGIYVPVFTQSSPGGLATYVVVFLVLVAVWCGEGRLLATRRSSPVR